jgi:hypothetical protein
LIEVLLVIIIAAILTAVLLIGFPSVYAANANAEAAKLTRSLERLRSGWLVYYSDKHKMLGVPNMKNGAVTHGKGSDVVRELSARSDKSVAEDAERYGDVIIARTPSGGDNGGTEAYIGFAGPWRGVRANDIKSVMKEILANGERELYTWNNEKITAYNGGENILLRIK